SLPLSHAGRRGSRRPDEAARDHSRGNPPRRSRLRGGRRGGHEPGAQAPLRRGRDDLRQRPAPARARRGARRADRARPGGGRERESHDPPDRGLSRGRLRPADEAPDRATRGDPGGGHGGGRAVRGFLPVLKKEAVQMIRDRGTLQFALLIPAFQLVLFGLIDTNVKHVRTVVFDQSRTQESRRLLDDFVNTSYFDIVAY